MTETAKVLVIDDEENMRHMLSALLKGEGYAVETAAHGRAGLELLQTKVINFVLCDIRMPEMDGLSFLKAAVEVKHSAVIIMMSAFGTVDTAIEAMKQGAYDFISKPFKTDEVVLVLKKAEERERLRRENIFLKKKIAGLEKGAGLGGMIGSSKAMQAIFQLADKVAKHSTTVLITGESGTGKELVARGIHEKSGRATNPFLAVNCGGIPENLLESEFFGHVRGAFTGADRDRKGLFEEADSGTLFLDEIGELPLSMQVKLLRVLQEQDIRRVGATVSRKVDVRIIAATARDLTDEVRQNRFREDLFYRLNVVNIHLPPLRERIADIPPLCDYFIEKFAISMNRPEIEGATPAALQMLLTHSWPGNVRELENVLERAVLLTEDRLIQSENLPEMLAGRRNGHPLDLLLGTSSIKKGRQIVDQWLIERAMEATGGNKSRAAELLEISYPSLLGKLKLPDEAEEGIL
ncbi:sigma-54-dependent Fis family transcriptional regulator [Desulfobulbus sp. F1]|nr:sigma-54-dependent Fis family transcriptional regulator [Desulfobulbus sp. F1]